MSTKYNTVGLVNNNAVQWLYASSNTYEDMLKKNQQSPNSISSGLK